MALSREDVLNNQLAMLKPSGWVDITLALPQLAAISHATVQLTSLPCTERRSENYPESRT